MTDKERAILIAEASHGNQTYGLYMDNFKK